MSIPQAFAQRGNTRRVTVTQQSMTAAMKVTYLSGSFGPANNYILTNYGPNTVYVGYGPDSNTAIANAAVPVDGDSTGKFCFVVRPGQRTVEAKADAYFAAITETGTAKLEITPGHGLVDGFGEGLDASERDEDKQLVMLLAYQVGAQQELLRGILIELRVLTNLLGQGLNVSDNPDSLRADEEPLIN